MQSHASRSQPRHALEATTINDTCVRWRIGVKEEKETPATRREIIFGDPLGISTQESFKVICRRERGEAKVTLNKSITLKMAV